MGPRYYVGDMHWGWESPTCQLRGHFLGHWLSAAACIAATTGDQEVKGKADYIIGELARCQQENGGEWVGSIPEKYLDWVARGKHVWAPHYTLHKTLMGLWDMYAVGGNAQALEILVKWARWFHRWSGAVQPGADGRHPRRRDRRHAGGVGRSLRPDRRAEHLDLIERYDRRRLFDPLLAGEDVLTNMHMNTTIPEAHGAARAWEVTGDARWRADRRGLLAQRRHRARLLLHRRPDQRRGLDATQCALGAPGRQHAGALHRLQHDAPGRLPAALER